MPVAGSFVRIEKVILSPEERTSKIPEETRTVPYIMRANGFLIKNCSIGEETEIRTFSGRILCGKLIMDNPPYSHDFGLPVPELLRLITAGGNND